MPRSVAEVFGLADDYGQAPPTEGSEIGTASDQTTSGQLAAMFNAGKKARELLMDRMSAAAYADMQMPALPDGSVQVRQALWADLVLDAVTAALMGVVPPKLAAGDSLVHKVAGPTQSGRPMSCPRSTGPAMTL